MIFDTHVAGIPCQCEITYFEPVIPAYIEGAPENCTPEEGGAFEFNLLDRRGYKATWLEKKLSKSDESRLYEEFKLESRAEDFIDPY